MSEKEKGRVVAAQAQKQSEISKRDYSRTPPDITRLPWLEYLAERQRFIKEAG